MDDFSLSDLMDPNLPPETRKALLQKLAQAGLVDERNGQLSEQIQEAVKMRNQPPDTREHHSFLAGLLPGVGNAIGTVNSMSQESKLRGQYDRNLQSKGDARAMQMDASLSNNPKTAQHMAALAILSGDPTLAKFGASQLEEARKAAELAQKTSESNMRYGPQAALGGVNADTYDSITKRRTQEGDLWSPLKDEQTGETYLFNKKTREIKPVRGGGGGAGGAAPPPAPSISTDAAPAPGSGNGAMQLDPIVLKDRPREYEQSSPDPDAEAYMRKKLPADVRKQIDDTEAALTAISKAKSAVFDQGGAFGPFQNVSNYMPKIQVAGIDPLAPLNELADAPARMARTPDQEQARAVVFQYAAEEIKRLSGTAVTASESSRLRQFMPDPNDTPKELRAKLEGIEEIAKAHRQRLLETNMPQIYKRQTRLRRALEAAGKAQ